VFAQLLKTETIPNAAKELDLGGKGLGDDGVVKIADVLKVRVIGVLRVYLRSYGHKRCSIQFAFCVVFWLAKALR
jgi:hypothetical protein